MKHAFPTDPVVDYVYRCTTGHDARARHTGGANTDAKYVFDAAGAAISPGRNMNTYAYGSQMYTLIYAEEPLHASVSAKENARLVLADEPLAYYSEYKGVMTARTSWDNPDALFVWFQPRVIKGGHAIRQSGGFVIVAHGLVWADMGAFYDGKNEDAGNVMVVDGVGQRASAPAKVLVFEHSDVITVCATDMQDPYNGYGFGEVR